MKQRKPARYFCTVHVSWGNEVHSLPITARNWQVIQSGKPVTIRGKGYYHEGNFFWDYWHFNGAFEVGRVSVTFGEGPEAGEGWSGELTAARIDYHQLREVNDGRKKISEGREAAGKGRERRIPSQRERAVV